VLSVVYLSSSFYFSKVELENLKNEMRFYIKDVLFKIIRYKGRGLLEYIRVHIMLKQIQKQ
jgi:hypothetical protein